MTTLYSTHDTLRDLRGTLYWSDAPKPRVLWRVFDDLRSALLSMTPIAEYRRVSVIARYHDPKHPRLRFILVLKR